MYFEQSAINNVRLQKHQERDEYEKEMERRKGEFLNIVDTVEGYQQQKVDLVLKMRSMFERILPNLSDNDYIIIIDKFNLVQKSYPFDKTTVESIVKHLQTYKKYISASMVDPKKLKEESQYDYQAILQKEQSEPSSKPAMLIPQQSASPFAPIDVTQNFQAPMVQIQSTPIHTITNAVQPTYLPKTTDIPIIPVQQTQPVIKEVVSQTIPTEIVTKDVSASPTFQIINYVDTKSVAVDPTKPIYFTAAICSDSLAQRHKFNSIPYILMVVNSKYKIPVYLRKKETDYYEFHKKKGPFYASRIDIQLFDHNNEVIQIKHKPTEIFHFLFETSID